MAIHIDVYARLHREQLRREAEQLARDLERSGQDAGGRYTKGLNKALGDADRVMDRASTRIEQATKRLNDTMDRGAERTKKANNDAAAAQQKLNEQLVKSEGYALRKAAADKVAAVATEKRTKREKELVDGWKDAKVTAEQQIRLSERLSQARDREALAINRAQQANQSWIASQARAAKANDDFRKSQENVRKTMVDSNRDIREASKDLQRTVIDSNEDIDRSWNRVHASVTRARTAFSNMNHSMSQMRMNAAQAKTELGGMGDYISQIGTAAYRFSRGLMYIAGPPLLIVLLDTVKALTTASQAIYLLPALTATAAAGIGTLKLAFSGFSDTIQALGQGDMEKFAEGLANLAPSAQQAALSIKELFPVIEQWRKATAEAFWAGTGGVGGMLDELGAIFLPKLQGLTTSIGASFNDMMRDVFADLTSAAGQADVQEIFDNIAGFFKEVTPAARDLVRALLDITAAGSDFLPELGGGIADLARDFADFIHEARESGKLHEWIQEGIDAVEALASGIWDLSKTLFNVFGEDGKKNVEDFNQMVDGLNQILEMLNFNFEGFGKDIREEFDQLTGPAETFVDALLDIPDAAAVVLNGMLVMGNGIVKILNDAFVKPINTILGLWNDIPLGLRMAIPGGGGPDIPTIPEIPDIPIAAFMPRGGFDWRGWKESHPAGGDSTSGGNVPRQPQGAPANPNPGDVWIEPGSGRRYVAVPKKGWVETSRTAPDHRPDRDVPKPGKDKNGNPIDFPADQWSLSNIPAGQFPGAEWNTPAGFPGGMPGMPGGGIPPDSLGIGYWEVDPQKVQEAEWKVDTARQNVEEARQKALQIAADNNHTEFELNKAKHDIVEKERALTSAQWDLAKEQQGKWKEMADAQKAVRQQIGMALDQDLGISNGLAGLAENLTRFLANLAFAPAFGALTAITATSGTAGPKTGLLGMLAPRTGIFGTAPGITGNMPPLNSSNYWQQNPMVPGFFNQIGIPDQGVSPGMANMTPTGGVNPLGGPTGPLPGPGGPDYGAHAGAPTVPPPDENSIRQWVQQNFGIPNTFGTGSWENASHEYDKGWHHMGQDLIPGGVKSGYGFDFSGTQQQMDSLANWIAQNAAGQTLELIYSSPGFNPSNVIKNGQFSPGAYDSGTLSQHTNHVHWATTVSPTGMANMSPGMGVRTSGFSGGSGTPVFVTNWPGSLGGIAAGGPPGAAGSASNPAAGGTATTGAFPWDAVAQKESGGNWSDNNSGGHEGNPRGGLQIKDATWAAFGGLEFAPNAAMASKEDQIKVANRIAFSGYKGQGPQGLKAWEVITNGSVPGVTVNTPGGTSANTQTNGAAPSNVDDLRRQLGGLSSGGGESWTPDVGGTTGGSNGANSGFPIPGGPAPAQVGPFFTPPSVAAAAPPLPPAPTGPGYTGPGAPGVGAGTTPGYPGAGGPGAGSVSGVPVTGSPTAQMGRYPGEGLPASGGIGIGGGLIGGALSAAAQAGGMAAGMGMGGGGGAGGGAGMSALAQIGVDELNRAIGAFGQYAGNAVNGLMETFLPVESELADPMRGWFGRIMGAVAGVRPVAENIAGDLTAKLLGGPGGGQGQNPPPLTPAQAEAQRSQMKAGFDAAKGTNINVTYNNNGATEDRAGADLSHNLQRMNVGSALASRGR